MSLSGSCSASFKVVSPGYGVSYKWQQSADGGSTWNNISDGGTNPVFAGTATSDLNITNALFTINNFKFRCIVGNLCGSDVISLPATLTIPPSTIRDQPVNDTIYTGQLTWFHTVSNLAEVRYQWQESRDGGSTWSNVVDGGTSPLYQYSNNIELFLRNVPLSYNNYKYRCVMSHNCKPDFISNAVTLFVIPTPQVTDIDGNTYNTMGVGPDLWMAENLKTTRYADGTTIPLVNSTSNWDALASYDPAYCWYGDNISNKVTYGALYTWTAATRGVSSVSYPSGVQGACPTGWHIPSWSEFSSTLILWDYSIAGGKLKETGTLHWQSPNAGATNEIGFKALPGGYRNIDGTFSNLGYESRFWVTGVSYTDGTLAEYFYMNYNSASIAYSYMKKESGHSVRCMKDQ